MTGTGPLVVVVPGMGDLRSSYRDVVPPLVAAGYRVAVMDLRGHGDSDATFHTLGDVATGQDLLTLVEHLGGQAVLVGNSMGAGAATWAAAERPESVAGLVLFGPFLRDQATSSFRASAIRLLYRVLLARPGAPPRGPPSTRRSPRAAGRRGTPSTSPRSVPRCASPDACGASAISRSSSRTRPSRHGCPRCTPGSRLHGVARPRLPGPGRRARLDPAVDRRAGPPGPGRRALPAAPGARGRRGRDPRVPRGLARGHRPAGLDRPWLGPG
ncbi:alpha/beta fold hydrolase [Oerskovia sp. M15]